MKLTWVTGRKRIPNPVVTELIVVAGLTGNVEQLWNVEVVEIAPCIIVINAKRSSC